MHDYMVKNNFTQSAEIFFQEAGVPSDAVPIDAPGGFIFEWWSVFWDVFSARANKQASKDAVLYVEVRFHLRLFDDELLFERFFVQNRNKRPSSKHSG